MGVPHQAVYTGQQLHVVAVHVTYPDALGNAVNQYEDYIWRTATGDILLHNTARARNITAEAIGYIHCPNNVLLAVSRLDVNRNTIELCGRNVGHVHGVNHVF